MPLTRLTRWVAYTSPFALFVAAFVATTPASGVMPVAQQSPARPNPTDVEVRCVDDSIMKLKLLDERLDIVTKYGKLEIPAADIRKIEFATRIPSEVAERIALLISNLNHPDFEMREKAMTELRDYRERSYFALLKAVKHPDAEISRRAEESVRYLQQKLPAGQLGSRDNDVVYTDDSKITGRLISSSLRVQTSMFGEQNLRLSDARSLRSLTGGAAGEDSAHAANAPTNLMAYQNQFGKEILFNVTGPQANGQAMSVWGTDIYTLDSNLAAAAVHAGLVQPGQSGLVRVRILTAPQQFLGSARNGVTSSPYGAFPSGAFEFLRR
jgi:hypothetical protein